MYYYYYNNVILYIIAEKKRFTNANAKRQISLKVNCHLDKLWFKYVVMIKLRIFKHINIEKQKYFKAKVWLIE